MQLYRLDRLLTSMTTAQVLPARGKAAKLVDERGFPSHLKCSSCQQPVFNSFQSPHGCRLCQTCVESLPVQEKVPCPGRTEACKDKDEDTSISQAVCFPDIASRREISKLPVFCPNKQDGCGAQFQWREVESHLNSCDYEKVQCEMCGEKRLKRELTDHKRNECSQRRVDCSLCGAQVVARLMDTEHKNLQSNTCCPHFTAVCPHCSEGAPINHVGYVLHIAVCRQRPMPCKFAHLGCTVVEAAVKLDAHYKDEVDKHLELIDSRLKVTAQIGAGAAAAAAAAAAATPGASAASNGPLHEAAELERKALSIFVLFKRLQPNVASWATVTIELEELMKSFGGASGFKAVLKVMEDKMRQIEAVERGSGVSGSTSVSEASRMLERIKGIELRFDALELTSYEGCLTWKVPGYASKRREAKSGSTTSLFSPPFFSKRYGYMYRVRLFLNGTEGSENGYLSIQIILTQSEYDDILDWPLVADVTFRLMHPRNRSEDVISKATLDAQRPSGVDDLSMNATVSRFAKISTVEEKFVKNDCIYIETEAEPRPLDVGRRGRRR